MIQKNWQELIRPEKQTVDQIVPGYKATLTIEPLERGFGATLGNALRRVMLSSLQGGAVKAVKIAGVQHEFSTIKGVVEDVRRTECKSQSQREKPYFGFVEIECQPEERKVVREAVYQVFRHCVQWEVAELACRLAAFLMCALVGQRQPLQMQQEIDV